MYKFAVGDFVKWIEIFNNENLVVIGIITDAYKGPGGEMNNHYKMVVMYSNHGAFVKGEIFPIIESEFTKLNEDETFIFKTILGRNVIMENYTILVSIPRCSFQPLADDYFKTACDNVDKLKLCGCNARVVPEGRREDILDNEIIIDVRSDSLNNLLINLCNKSPDIRREFIEKFIEENR